MTDCLHAPPPLLIQGIEEFNASAYFECHETLEQLWMDVTSPVRELYQGILQVAVGLYKLEQNVYRGAVKLLSAGVRHLERFDPVCQGVDVAQLIADADCVREALEALGPDNMQALDRRLIPHVHWATTAPVPVDRSGQRLAGRGG